MVRIKRPQRVIACKYNSFPLRETRIDKEVENSVALTKVQPLNNILKMSKKLSKNHKNIIQLAP
jgi:hypothetical protein